MVASFSLSINWTGQSLDSFLYLHRSFLVTVLPVRLDCWRLEFESYIRCCVYVSRRATKHRDPLSRVVKSKSECITLHTSQDGYTTFADLPRHNSRTLTRAAAPLSPPLTYARRHGALSHSQRSGQYHAHNVRWVSPLFGPY